LPDPTTVFAGPALLANVRNQSEHEALAARCHTRSGVPPSSSSTAYAVPLPSSVTSTAASHTVLPLSIHQHGEQVTVQLIHRIVFLAELGSSARITG
jgi:hypothetical protein